MRASKILAAVFAINSTCSFAQVSGDLDITFSADGIATTDIQPPSSDNATCMALQPDGRIVVAGNSIPQLSGTYAVALARYLPDGSLDPSFGAGGTLTTAIGTMDDAVQAIAIQPDGKIVVGGTSFENGNGYLFLIVRYNADGSLDNSFSGNGWRTDNIGVGSEDRILSIALQADGKIVAAGRARNGTDYDIALARYNTDGSLDNTFSGDGILISPVGPGDDEAVGVAVQAADQHIVIAGYSGDGTDDHFTVVRFTTDGTPDASFGTGGVVATSYSTGIDRAFAIALQPDGRILAGGLVSNGLQLNLAVMRYETDGDLDNSFDTDGMVISLFSPFGNARSLALMPDGRIVAGGSSGSVFLLNVFNTDGTPDNTFSGDGALSTSVGSNNYGNAVAVQPDGKILLAGIANFPNTANDFTVLRYHTDLSIGLQEFGGTDQAPLIYPNPTDGSATLQFAQRNGERINIRLVDLQGRIVQTFFEGVAQQAGEHRVQLDFPASVAAGMYTLVISNATGGQVSVQVVKE